MFLLPSARHARSLGLGFSTSEPEPLPVDRLSCIKVIDRFLYLQLTRWMFFILAEIEPLSVRFIFSFATGTSVGASNCSCNSGRQSQEGPPSTVQCISTGTTRFSDVYCVALVACKIRMLWRTFSAYDLVIARQVLHTEQVQSDAETLKPPECEQYHVDRLESQNHRHVLNGIILHLEARLANLHRWIWS